MVEMWQRRRRAASPRRRFARLSQLASGDERDGGAAGAGLGRGQQAAHHGFPAPCSIASSRTTVSLLVTHYTVADITGLVAVDFMKPAKLAVPDELEQRQALARRRLRAPERAGLSHGHARSRSSDRGMPSAPAADSTPASSWRPRKGRCWSIAAHQPWSRSRRAASIRCGSTGSCSRICTAIISAALPFLLLDAQFLARRERPLTIAGPPGTRERLDQLLEVFFPRSTGNEVAVSLERGRDRDRPRDRDSGPQRS